MKKKTLISLLLTLALLCGLLTGCGASSESNAAVKYEMAYDSAAAETLAASGNTLTESGSGSSSTLPESRKWIITVNMSAETEDLDALLAALEEEISSLEGYVEGQNIYNGSTYSSRRYRSASLTVRVPAQDVDSFTSEVAGLANVVSSSKNLEDVTLSYVATESRMNALQVEEARLLELMEKAETMADLLEIEERLTDVRYELESTTSRLRLYDNQIDYATIYLNIEEVQEYTPVEEPTLWERISGGFQRSLKGLSESLLDILVWLTANSPYIVVYGGILLLIVLLVKRHRKHKREKKETQTPPQNPEEAK